MTYVKPVFRLPWQRVYVLQLIYSLGQKPLDISHPEIVTSETDAMRGFLALTTQTQLCKVSGAQFIVHPTAPGNDIDGQSMSSRAVPIEYGVAPELDQSTYAIPALVDRDEKNASFSAEISAGEVLASGVAYTKLSDSIRTPPNRLRLMPSDVTRLERAAAFVNSIKMHDNSEIPYAFPLSHFDYEDCLAEHGNFYFGFEDRHQYSWFVNAMIATTTLFDLSALERTAVPVKVHSFFTPKALIPLFALVYGGIHIVAWEYNFPGDVERYMWRVSSVVASCALFSILPVVILHVICTSLIDWILLMVMRFYIKGTNLKIKLEGLLKSGFVAFVLLLAVLNLSSRVLLTVEAFLSLRSLPVGAYAMPAWLQMMPHL